MRLPHNPDAERSLIGCFLTSPEAFEIAGEVTPDDFLSPHYRAIYETITALRDGGIQVDLVSVGDEMQRRGVYGAFVDSGDSLALIAANAPIAQTAQHYASLVTRDGTLRRLISLCAELTERAGDNGASADELVSEAQLRIADLAVRGVGGPRPLGETLGGLMQAVEDRARNPEGHRVSIGIGSFDRMIGGIKAPQLVVVAARPGVGKSAFVGNLLWRAAKRGVPGLLFSLEMSATEMAERIVGAEARLSVHSISTGKIDYGQFKSLHQHCARLSSLPLWVDDRVLTAQQITANAKRWRAQNPAPQAIVAIDYVGLIRSTDKAETRALEVGRMAWAAKALAKDINCPVVLVSQLNRASEKDGREPVLSDLRDSGEIEQHADMVIFPHRPQMLSGSGPASLIVAKHRGGPTGRVSVQWHAEFMTFEESAEEAP